MLFSVIITLLSAGRMFHTCTLVYIHLFCIAVSFSALVPKFLVSREIQRKICKFSQNFCPYFLTHFPLITKNVELFTLVNTQLHTARHPSTDTSISMLTPFCQFFTLFYCRVSKLNFHFSFLCQAYNLVYLLLFLNGFSMIKYVSFKPVKMIDC